MKCLNHFTKLHYHYQKDCLDRTHLIEECLYCKSVKRFVPMWELSTIELKQPVILYELSKKEKKTENKKKIEVKINQTIMF